MGPSWFNIIQHPPPLTNVFYFFILMFVYISSPMGPYSYGVLTLSKPIISITKTSKLGDRFDVIKSARPKNLHKLELTLSYLFLL